jgi:hypothetical protein
MQARVPANRLTSAPISMSNPSAGTPPMLRQHIHLSLACAQILAHGVEADYFGVGANVKKAPARTEL